MKDLSETGLSNVKSKLLESRDTETNLHPVSALGSRLLCRSLCIRSLALLGVFLFAAACASRPTPSPVPAEPSANLATPYETERIQPALDPLEIRPGYLLAIRHPADAKLRVEARVGSDGVLQLPYERKLQTAGLSLTTLTSEIRTLYRDLYQSPQSISVSLVQRKLWVEVHGLVKKPGAKLIDSKSTLDELLAEADLTEPRADFARIDLGQRSQLIDLKKYSAGQWPTDKTPAWVGGEAIWLLRGESLAHAGTGNVRLLGEVNQPGSFAFQDGKTILDYLSLAGGPKSGANLERVYLYRPSAENAGPVELSLLEPIKLPIGPGDTLLFSSERASTLERRFQLGANLAAILSAIGVILIAL
jgi:protein involved in polysaccharide export with SLBB domain